MLTAKGPGLQCPKISWTLVHKQLKIGPLFYPHSVNSAFCFIVRHRTRKSANGTQPTFAKLWEVNRARYSRKNWGKNCLLLVVFSTTKRLNDEYFQKETYHGQPANGVGNYEGSISYSLSKFHELNGLKLPSYLPTLRECYMLLL